MQRRIVLVGPPGVGKSTLVKLAKEKGIHAVDIEDIHYQTKPEFMHLSGENYRDALNQAMAIKIINLLENAPEGVSIFGAGGYGSHFPINMIEKVLLLPPKDIAQERFRKRDAINPAKKAQNHNFEKIYEDLKSGEKNCHRVITSIKTPEETLEEILKEELQNI